MQSYVISHILEQEKQLVPPIVRKKRNHQGLIFKVLAENFLQFDLDYIRIALNTNKLEYFFHCNYDRE